MVVVSIDPRGLLKLTKRVNHIRDGAARVLAPAINRALAKGRTEVKREIRKIYEIKAKDIPVKVRPVSRANVTSGMIHGEVRITQGMLDLNKFKVQPKGVQHGRKRPIRVSVKKGRFKTLRHAFVAPMPSGYIGPFERVGKTRLPIRKLIAIGASIMASQPSVGPAVNKAMDETLHKAINQQITRLLAK